MYNEPEKDLNLEGYCFEMSWEDLLFTKGMLFSCLDDKVVLWVL